MVTPTTSVILGVVTALKAEPRIISPATIAARDQLVERLAHMERCVSAVREAIAALELVGGLVPVPDAVDVLERTTVPVSAVLKTAPADHARALILAAMGAQRRSWHARDLLDLVTASWSLSTRPSRMRSVVAAAITSLVRDRMLLRFGPDKFALSELATVVRAETVSAAVRALAPMGRAS